MQLIENREAAKKELIMEMYLNKFVYVFVQILKKITITDSTIFMYYD